MNNGDYGWSDEQETYLRLAESLADNNHHFKIEDLQRATHSDLMPTYFTHKYKDDLGVIDYEIVRLMKDKDITNMLNYLSQNTILSFNYWYGHMRSTGIFNHVKFHRHIDNTWCIVEVEGFPFKKKSYATLSELLGGFCDYIEEGVRYECDAQTYATEYE